MITTEQALWLGLLGCSADEVNGFASLRMPVSPTDLIALVEAGVTSTSVAELESTGMVLRVGEVLGLAQAGLSPAQAALYRRGDLTLTTEQLLVHHRDRLAELAKRDRHAESIIASASLADADFAGRTTQTVSVKSPARGSPAVPASFAAECRRLGFTSPADVEMLFRHNVHPVFIKDLHDAGLHPSPADLVRAIKAGLNAHDAKALLDAGYRFTVEDLIAIASAEVDPAFAVSLLDERFPVLSADQLVDLHRRGLDVQTIRELRGSATQSPVSAIGDSY